MRQTAHVVQVQCVPSIIWSSDIGVSPVRSFAQIELGVRARKSRRQRPVGACERKVKLRGAQFHVVTPFRLSVKIKWRGREQIARGRSISECKNVFGGDEASVSELHLRFAEYLGAFRKVSRQASR